jgi:hypothetical protein
MLKKSSFNLLTEVNSSLKSTMIRSGESIINKREGITQAKRS